MKAQREADDPTIPEHCDRVMCREGATALLLFNPRNTQAWLADIEAGSRTIGISLCPAHADRVSVPAGWDFADDRKAVAAPAASEPEDSPASGEDSEPSVRLASITAIADSDDESADDGSADDGSVEEVAAEAGDSGSDEVSALVDDAPKPDTNSDGRDPDGVVSRPTLWDDEQAEGLTVGASTPMLSRAFRAAHVE